MTPDGQTGHHGLLRARIIIAPKATDNQAIAKAISARANQAGVADVIARKCLQLRGQVTLGLPRRYLAPPSHGQPCGHGAAMSAARLMTNSSTVIFLPLKSTMPSA